MCFPPGIKPDSVENRDTGYEERRPTSGGQIDVLLAASFFSIDFILIAITQAKTQITDTHTHVHLNSRPFRVFLFQISRAHTPG